MPNGLGSYTWENGHFYHGEMKDGLMHGKGRWIENQLNNKSDQYNGYFKNGMRDGLGLFTGSDGSIYSGKWRKG